MQVVCALEVTGLIRIIYIIFVLFFPIVIAVLFISSSSLMNLLFYKLCGGCVNSSFLVLCYLFKDII